MVNFSIEVVLDDIYKCKQRMEHLASNHYQVLYKNYYKFLEPRTIIFISLW